MRSFEEAWAATAPPRAEEDGHAWHDDEVVEPAGPVEVVELVSPTEPAGPAELDEPAESAAVEEPGGPTAVEETPANAAARVLELATVTADQVVAEAKREAASLVTAARSEAAEILEASRNEAAQVAAELERTKAEQVEELEHVRRTTLAGLAEEKAALEDQIATLRRLDSDYRTQMRQRLTEQLSQLDAVTETPVTPEAD